MDKGLSRFAGFLATTRVAETGLAIQKYRFANQGATPSSLQQLTPDYLSELPLDPMDGRPLRYQIEGNGYVVYSVGQNLKDDGGKDAQLVKGIGADDIYFRTRK